MFTINLVAYGQDSIAENKTEKNGTTWLSLTKDTFEIKYPSTWEVDTSGRMGSKFILFSQPSKATDQFRENVNLLVQDLTGYKLTLDQYVELSENQVKTMMTASNLLLSERQKGGKHPYHKTIYTGKQGIFDLKFEQYYWVIGQKAVVLTLTCEANQFDTYQKVGEEILNSFKIK